MQNGGWKMNASSSEEGGREGKERKETGTFIQATNIYHHAPGTMLLLKKGEKQNSYFCGMYIPEVGG